MGTRKVIVQPGAWWDRALCRRTPRINFYPGGNHAGPAKRVCALCPVRQQCLDLALANNEQHGIWGGMSVHERRQYRRQKQAEAELAEALTERNTA